MGSSSAEFTTEHLRAVLLTFAFSLDHTVWNCIDSKVYSEKYWASRGNLRPRAVAKPNMVKAAPPRPAPKPKAAPKSKNRTKRLQKQVRYWKARAAELAAKVSAMEAESRDKSLTHLGKRRKTSATRLNLTVNGGFKLALQRNVGHASADALLSHMDTSVSRYSVSRWEQLFASTIIAMARHWYASHYYYLSHCHKLVDKPGLSYELHLVSADATNTSVSLGVKAHVCKVKTLFRHLDANVLRQPVKCEVSRGLKS